MVDSSLDITSELLLTQNSLVLTALASLELVAEKRITTIMVKHAVYFAATPCHPESTFNAINGVQNTI